MIMLTKEQAEENLKKYGYNELVEGKKKSIFHSVFHVFVVIGTVCQAVCILLYVL